MGVYYQDILREGCYRQRGKYTQRKKHWKIKKPEGMAMNTVYIYCGGTT